MDLSPTQLSLLGTVCTAVGWLTNHWLRIGLDRRSRLRNFRNRISCVIAEIEAEADKGIYSTHRKSKPVVRDESASIMEDIRWWRRNRLKRISLKYCGLTERDAGSDALKHISQHLFARAQSEESSATNSAQARNDMTTNLHKLLKLAK